MFLICFLLEKIVLGPGSKPNFWCRDPPCITSTRSCKRSGVRRLNVWRSGGRRGERWRPGGPGSTGAPCSRHHQQSENSWTEVRYSSYTRYTRYTNYTRRPNSPGTADTADTPGTADTLNTQITPGTPDTPGTPATSSV